MPSSLVINRVQTKFNSLKILLNSSVLRKASVILQKKMFLPRVYRFQVVKEKFVVKGTSTSYREQTHLFCANDQEIFSVLIFHFYRHNLFPYSYYSASIFQRAFYFFSVKLLARFDSPRATGRNAIGLKMETNVKTIY